MRSPVAFLALLLQLGVPAPAGAPPEPAPLVIAHATVIDMTGAPPRRDVSVLVRGDRIVAVAPAATLAVPADARVVDATGKYLIPGLWDMHVHLGQATAAALPVLLAEGVTGVRDMGSDFTLIQRWRREIAEGTRPGPRIVAAGPILDGPEHAPAGSRERIGVADPARARQLVDSLADLGVDFIKVYDFLAPAVYDAIVREAAARRLTVVGHVPRAVGIGRAIDAGQRSIEHLSGVPLPCPFAMRLLARAPGAHGAMPPCGDDDARARVFARMRAAGTWVVPTLVSFRGMAATVDPRAGAPTAAELRLAAPALRAHWAEHLARWPRFVPASYRAELPKLFEPTAAQAHRAGVRMLAGSDLGNPNVIPGVALHEELARLVAVGLTPMEALRAATRDPAAFLGLLDSLGTVEPGKLADLVLLDADPLANIANTRRISAVVARGRLYDGAALERMK